MAWSLAAALFSAAGNAAYLSPSPYLSFSDSPLKDGAFRYFHLEDFEDGALNTPGVSAAGGVVLRAGLLTDSVDADDGAVDGSGRGGSSFYSAGSDTLTFMFNGSALGGLPTDVGLVWTDVGFSNDTTNTCAAGQQKCGFGNVLFEAFDSGNISLGVIGPLWLGDGDVGGQTAEDHYFGVSNAGGISRITLTIPGSLDWEMDHLQYGRTVPEPPSVALLVLGLLATGWVAFPHGERSLTHSGNDVWAHLFFWKTSADRFPSDCSPNAWPSQCKRKALCGAERSVGQQAPR